MASSTSTAAVLKIHQLTVRYPGATDSPATLDGLDLRLDPGDRLALVGPSGCGKSTVARAVVQLLPAGSKSSGELLLCGQDPRRLRRAALQRLSEDGRRCPGGHRFDQQQQRHTAQLVAEQRRQQQARFCQPSRKQRR